eukprot:447617-Pleurochrysis_carterae.AAC.2
MISQLISSKNNYASRLSSPREAGGELFLCYLVLSLASHPLSPVGWRSVLSAPRRSFVDPYHLLVTLQYPVDCNCAISV